MGYPSGLHCGKVQTQNAGDTTTTFKNSRICSKAFEFELNAMQNSRKTPMKETSVTVITGECSEVVKNKQEKEKPIQSSDGRQNPVNVQRGHSKMNYKGRDSSTDDSPTPNVWTTGKTDTTAGIKSEGQLDTTNVNINKEEVHEVVEIPSKENIPPAPEQVKLNCLLTIFS